MRLRSLFSDLVVFDPGENFDRSLLLCFRLFRGSCLRSTFRYDLPFSVCNLYPVFVDDQYFGIVV